VLELDAILQVDQRRRLSLNKGHKTHHKPPAPGQSLSGRRS
jgi:hypothetical protein